MKYRKIFLIPVFSVILLIIIISAIAGLSVRERLLTLSSNNEQMMAELSGLRQRIYVAKSDIKAGDEIHLKGELVNIERVQMYSSIDPTLCIDDTATGYAQADIKAGSPVYASLIGKDIPAAAIEPERIVEEVPISYDIPYKLIAHFIDEKGKDLLESELIPFHAQITEQAFLTEAKLVDGYVLKSVQINKTPVYSFGAVRIEKEENMAMVYYYTDKTGQQRTEITEDLEVYFTYKKGDKNTLSEADLKLIGIVEPEKSQVNQITEEDVSRDSDIQKENRENPESSAIILEDITANKGRSIKNGKQ